MPSLVLNSEITTCSGLISKTPFSVGRIQMERKSEGMKRSDKVEVYINADDETASLIKKDVSQFAKDINAKKVEIVNDFESGLKAIPLEIMETQLRVAIKKIGV